MLYDHSMRVSGVQVRYGYTDHSTSVKAIALAWLCI